MSARTVPAAPPKLPENYQAVYRLACRAALYALVAEEALTILETPEQELGASREAVLQRVTELRERLEHLDDETLRGT